MICEPNVRKRLCPPTGGFIGGYPAGWVARDTVRTKEPESRNEYSGSEPCGRLVLRGLRELLLDPVEDGLAVFVLGFVLLRAPKLVL